MAFVTVTPDVTDVFSNFPHKPAVGTASLNEMTRNEGADLLYRQRCDITQRSVPHVETINNADAIKLLRSDRSSDTLPYRWPDHNCQFHIVFRPYGHHSAQKTDLYIYIYK